MHLNLSFNFSTSFLFDIIADRTPMHTPMQKIYAVLLLLDPTGGGGVEEVGLNFYIRLITDMNSA